MDELMDKNGVNFILVQNVVAANNNLNEENRVMVRNQAMED